MWDVEYGGRVELITDGIEKGKPGFGTKMYTIKCTLEIANEICY